jgi:hypothetical protein
MYRSTNRPWNPGYLTALLKYAVPGNSGNFLDKGIDAGEALNEAFQKVDGADGGSDIFVELRQYIAFILGSRFFECL